MTDLQHLQTLAKQYPDVGAALVELANLESVLTLPKSTVHVVSDVHGEFSKLRQVINNASGSLRPLVEQVLGNALTPTELTDVRNLFYYPRETWFAMTAGMSAPKRRMAVLQFTERAIAVIRELAKRYTIKHVERIMPDPFDPVFRELLFGRELQRSQAFLEKLVDPFVRHDRELELVRMLSRVVRNLSVGELIVAGDLGDRGPRIDKVIELLEQQPNVSITWGNHDADWLAATLGQPAAIATVVRLSLRYQRLAQLEEGLGISLAPVALLARTIYGNDPATQFGVKGDNADPTHIARMQKAIAIIQFKLEGALFRKHTEWNLEHRALLHRIDPKTGTITIDGKTHPLLDTNLPTIDWKDPYALSPEEAQCMAELTRSFVGSGTLWKHQQFVASRALMSLVRDRCVIFHGCVPVDADGNFLTFPIDGVPQAGKKLFDALERVIQRAVRKRAEADLDLVFYLWTGPLSPCFGKDRMATFETYFIADKATHDEHKNPYFKLLNDPVFCAKVLTEFGVDPVHGYIINGHVPVKLEQGETPMKKSHRAITIDGAFAAAYGDKGFSLVLDANRMYLAQHHHFDGAEAVVARGEDLVPTVSEVEVYPRPRTVGETEKGVELRAEIAALEQLVAAFDANLIRAGGQPT